MSWITNPEGPLAKEFRPVPKSGQDNKRTKNKDKRTEKSQKRSQKKAKRTTITAEEKKIRAAVIQRDGMTCYICQKENKEKKEIGQEFHHILPKQMGGRGVLKKLIDSEILRVLIGRCHDRVHTNEITPYNFYRWAVEDQFQQRIIVMELMIDEWASYVPLSKGKLIDQIRKKNKKRWKKILGDDHKITPQIIATHYQDILSREVKKIEN